MKKGITVIIVLLFLAGCSTDSENNEMLETSALVGTWNMTDVRFEEDPNDTSLNLADEIVDQLADENCFLVSFTFNADGTVSSEDKVNFIQVNAGPMGLDIPCPEDSVVETAQWSLEGNQLTITGDNQEETITIQLEGNTFVIAGADINAENYTGAEAVFTRQ
ncbi:lipocalin family protein [uncultured Croceitalea sp.]|uniref:lipocalin family protein n=1 Tax=uncultured Croceitalea sp. TaxID=1798908 RepID=UPI003305716E